MIKARLLAELRRIGAQRVAQETRTPEIKRRTRHLHRNVLRDAVRRSVKDPLRTDLQELLLRRIAAVAVEIKIGVTRHAPRRVRRRNGAVFQPQRVIAQDIIHAEKQLPWKATGTVIQMRHMQPQCLRLLKHGKCKVFRGVAAASAMDAVAAEVALQLDAPSIQRKCAALNAVRAAPDHAGIAKAVL